MKSSRIIGASLLAIALATPAFAQTPQPAAAQPAAEEENNSPDIIVTASKRAQTLQDTPISVAVATAASIEQSQIRDLIDLQTLVPSLKVGQLQSSANTNFIIRGFGNGANNAGIEPSVGVFIDGVYRSRSAAQIGDLPNIDRVEVLRGPQSTLFGKNASAGIISIVTAEPKFEFGGQIEASYGNYNAIVVKGSVTGPLSEQIAVSLGGNYNRRDGYARYTNLNQEVNNRNRYGIRGQILFQPNSDFKVRIIGDYDRIDEVCCAVANLTDGPTGNAIRALTGGVNGTGLVPNQPFVYNSFANIPSVNKIDNYGVSAQLDARLTDGLSVVSISAYRGVKSFGNADSDFTGADLIGENSGTTKIDTFTQELRLVSDFDGPLNFLLGGFYFNEKIDINSRLLFGRDFRGYADLISRDPRTPTVPGGYITAEPTIRAVNAAAIAANPTLFAQPFGSQGQGRFEAYNYKNEAFSIFGQLDFEIVDGLTLTLGGNYTVDRKNVRTNSSTTDAFSTIDLVATGVPLVTNAGIATGVGNALQLPGGRQATAAEIQAFAAAQPAIFAQIQAGAAAFANSPAGFAANPLCPINPVTGARGGLCPLQFLPPFLNFPNAVESGRTKDDNFSYTVRLAYKFNNRMSAYATYATGFKATSFNLSTDSRPFAADFIPGSPVQNPRTSRIRGAGLALNNLTTGTRFAGPENAEVYEVGLKGNFDGFGFNLALFRQILKGFQSNIFQGTGFVLGNAEQQSTNGLELDTTITPIRNLVFTASLTYLDPKFDLFTGGSSFQGNPALPNFNGVVPTNLTGFRPSGQSEFSYAVGATYTQEFNDDLKAIFHVDYDGASGYVIAQGLPFKASPETLNASVTVAMSNGLELSVWGRNLSAPKYNATIFPSVAQAGSLSAYPSPPAFYGASARFKF